jgi:hypothetical protein
MIIPIGEYRPDLPALDNPGATLALNLLPGPTSYAPLPSLSPLSSALAARCQGAFAARDSAGNVSNFAGTATGLYRLVGTGWSNVTRTVGGPYNTPIDGAWRFAQFGKLVIGVNGVDAPQKWTLGATTAFAALGGTPPVGACIATVRDFVVIGRIGDTPGRVQWSAINNAESWTPSAATQADFQDLPDGGWVQGIVGGEAGIVLQERAIKRMTYVGTPLVFQIDEIARGRGAAAPGSIATFERTTFFLDNDGFYALTGADQLTPIGAQRVDKTFWKQVDQRYLHRVSAAIDPIGKLYVLAYPAAGNVGGRPNRLMIYNWTADRWSEAEIETELVHTALSESSYTLDGLNAVSATLDGLPFSLDSRAWTGGLILLSAFDGLNRVSLFTGPNLEARAETGEGQLAEGSQALITAVRPLVDGGSVTVQVGTRDRPDASVSWSAPSPRNVYGLCPLRAHGRYHRARVTVAAGGSWTHLQGLEVEMAPAGRR